MMKASFVAACIAAGISVTACGNTSDAESVDSNNQALSGGAKAKAKVVTAFDGSIGELPEGVVVPDRGPNAGSTFVSISPYAAVYKVTNGSASFFATIADPTARLATGLGADGKGGLYVAIAESGDPGGTAPAGIYKVPAAGGTATLLTPADLPVGLPNGIDVIGNSAYWTDSILGVVYVTDIHSGATQVWSDNALLAGDPAACGGNTTPFPFPVGANGITHHGNKLYVSNTNFGRIVRFDIKGNGKAGHAKVIAEGCDTVKDIDGIVADRDGTLIATRQFSSSVVRVTKGGKLVPIYEGAPLDGPASPFFVSGPHGARSLLVTNSTFGSPPGGPGPSLVSLTLRGGHHQGCDDD
jgi:hypothetical protein